MKSNYLVWVVVVILVLAGGYYWMNKSTIMPSTSYASPTPVATSTTLPLTVALATQNGLGQSGTATFTQNASGKLVVTLALSGGNFTGPQPAHIHVGSCPNPGAVKYPLTSVVGGKSETTLDVSWADLEATGSKLALNIHKSASESSVYTACGDLPVKAATMATTPSTAPTTAPTTQYSY